MKHKCKIQFFKDQFEKFSNFYPCDVELNGIIYPTVEHAYQACKTKDQMLRMKIRKVPADKAGKAKRMGRSFKLRSDWELIKISVMRNLLKQKFNKDEFKSLLLSTRNIVIEEGNYYHDNEWGNCYCKRCSTITGKNRLGKLLMEIRDKLRKVDLNENYYYR